MANEIGIAFGPQPAGIGNKHVHVVKAVIDTYTAGGIAIPVPASITEPVVLVQASNGYVGDWDAVNGKLVLYTAPNTEAATVSATVFIVFIGQ